MKKIKIPGDKLQRHDKLKQVYNLLEAERDRIDTQRQNYKIAINIIQDEMDTVEEEAVSDAGYQPQVDDWVKRKNEIWILTAEDEDAETEETQKIEKIAKSKKGNSQPRGEDKK